MKAFLGTGLLGSGFVRAMIKKGEKVQVWNRTAAKAKELEQYGAIFFENIADAVKGADIIHVALRDDFSVDEALQKAALGFMEGAVIVDHTTTSVEGAVKRTTDWKIRGFKYQHAPVFMGPQNALDSSGYMLVSGNQQLVKKTRAAVVSLNRKTLEFR